MLPPRLTQWVRVFEKKRARRACERRSHVLLKPPPADEMSVDARLHLYCVVVPRARYVLQAAFRRARGWRSLARSLCLQLFPPAGVT